MGYSEPIIYTTFNLSHAPSMKSMTADLLYKKIFLNYIYELSSPYSLFAPYPIMERLTTEIQQNKYNT